MLEFINPSGPTIPGISHAVVARSGELVFLSGHVPLRDDGAVETGPLEAQLEAAFRCLHQTMEAAGIPVEHLVRITIYVCDYHPSDLPTIRNVRDRYVATAAPPASTLIGVASLFAEGVRVEVDAIAVRVAD